jgi:hypothetical protein
MYEKIRESLLYTLGCTSLTSAAITITSLGFIFFYKASNTPVPTSLTITCITSGAAGFMLLIGTFVSKKINDSKVSNDEESNLSQDNDDKGCMQTLKNLLEHKDSLPYTPINTADPSDRIPQYVPKHNSSDQQLAPESKATTAPNQTHGYMAF